MSEIVEAKRKTVAALRAELESVRRDSEELLQFRISKVTLREIREEIHALEKKRALARRNNLAWSRSDEARLNALVRIPENWLFDSMREKETTLLSRYDFWLKHLNELESVSESSLEEKRKTVAALQAEHERWGEDIKKYWETQISGVTLREIEEEIDSLRNKHRIARENNLTWSSADEARLDALEDLPEISVYWGMCDEESSAMTDYHNALYELKNLEAVLAYQAPHSPPKVEDGAVLCEHAGPIDPNLGGQLIIYADEAFVNSMASKLSTSVTQRRTPNEHHMNTTL